MGTFGNVFIFAGDEIFAVNGNLLQGLSHSEAIAIFKQIRSGPVVLQTGRRSAHQHYQHNHHHHHQQQHHRQQSQQHQTVVKSVHNSSTTQM